MDTKKIHLGKLLLEKKLISPEQLDKAIAQHELTGEKLGQVLTNLGYLKEDTICKLLSEQLAIPYIQLDQQNLNPEVVQLLPEFYARRFRCLAIENNDEGLLVGMVDPLDLLAYDELVKLLKRPIRIAIVSETDLMNAIDLLYRHTTEITNLAEELSAELGTHDFDVAQLGKESNVADAPVIKLLQTIFDDAVQMSASDVHIEPDEALLRIRLRIDGILHEQIVKEKQIAQALTLRLKLMAGLNIAEKRLPQDGRFSLKIKDKNFDVRLSTLPVQFGESVVMRLLDQSASILDLDHAGIPPEMLERIRKIITLPNGMLLITGPTGSGKTTTLYGILSEINEPNRKIITVEDPVEYRLPRINQVQVQSKIDLTFARVLRAALRQDPDVIMVGELRDQETVAIAMRASMTGHFVYSTLHTNDAISSAIRLLDMGSEGFLVATVLRAIIAQRLVRRICQNCSQNYEPTPQERLWLSQTASNITEFKSGKGCRSCHNTGYKGQIGVYELLEINPALADALRRNDTDMFVHLAEKDEQYKPLINSGLNLVAAGITTVSEVIRLVGEDLGFKEEENTAVV